MFVKHLYHTLLISSTTPTPTKFNTRQPQYPGNPACFSRGIHFPSWDSCCHPKFGPDGNANECWDDLGLYSYERCCYKFDDHTDVILNDDSFGRNNKKFLIAGRIGKTYHPTRDKLIYHQNTLEPVQILNIHPELILSIINKEYPFESYNLLTLMVENPTPQLIASLESQGFVLIGIFPDRLDYLLVHRDRFEQTVGSLCEAYRMMTHFTGEDEFYVEFFNNAPPYDRDGCSKYQHCFFESGKDMFKILNSVKLYGHPERYPKNALVIEIGAFEGNDMDSLINKMFQQNISLKQMNFQFRLYEPVNKLYNKLESKFKQHPVFQNFIYPYNVGVGNKNKKVCMDSNSNDPLSGFTRECVNGTIPVVDILETYNIDTEKVFLLHINCEGCEVEILERLMELNDIDIMPQNIEVQFHSQHVDYLKYCEIRRRLMDDFGYDQIYHYNYVWDLFSKGR